MIKIENITYSYENNLLFNNFSYTFKDGTITTVKGESGKGKTTLLYLLMGFEIPQKGKIFYDEIELSPPNIKTIRQEIAWLPQDFNLKINTIEELFFSLFELKNNKKKYPSKQQIAEMFNALGIEENMIKKRIDEVSGGQKQRILLASILLSNKKYVFLDEPTSALDKISTEKFIKIMKNTNATFIISTHDNILIKEADNVIDLDNGTILNG